MARTFEVSMLVSMLRARHYDGLSQPTHSRCDQILEMARALVICECPLSFWSHRGRSRETVDDYSTSCSTYSSILKKHQHTKQN